MSLTLQWPRRVADPLLTGRYHAPSGGLGRLAPALKGAGWRHLAASKLSPGRDYFLGGVGDFDFILGPDRFVQPHVARHLEVAVQRARFEVYISAAPWFVVLGASGIARIARGFVNDLWRAERVQHRRQTQQYRCVRNNRHL